MSNIPMDFINKLNDVQPTLWPQVSNAVSEAANALVNFSSPLMLAAATNELQAELNMPMLALQFAFADAPENAQAILINPDSALALASLVLSREVTSVDENLIADLRAPLEAIIQGLCVGVGNKKGEPVVASGLSIRYQSFTFPSNLLASHEIVRTQVAMTGEDLNGTLIWLFDDVVAAFLIGEQAPSQDAEPGSQAFAQNVNGGAQVYQLPRHDNDRGIDLLMDIPLEISVELGRVKMLVRDVVELGTGSIVEIEKAAGEPVEVLVNGRPVARGEVVVIEDNFGVRITEILNPQERLARLGEAA